MIRQMGHGKKHCFAFLNVSAYVHWIISMGFGLGFLSYAYSWHSVKIS